MYTLTLIKHILNICILVQLYIIIIMAYLDQFQNCQGTIDLQACSSSLNTGDVLPMLNSSFYNFQYVETGF